MLLLLVASIAITIVKASDIYCAWNRAVKPVSENNAGTFNFINGEFTRWYNYSSGDLWQGQPYYIQTIDTCYVSVLYLYRYMDSSSLPPTFKWVIAANMGVKPIYGYAYCDVDTSLQSAPSGSCDNNWMIGPPQDDVYGQTAAQSLDANFFLQAGGCPQVTCASLDFNDNKGDDWAGIFSYYSPNVYRRADTGGTSFSGYWFLFFNPKVWTWAVHEESDEYDVCENYKTNKGFTSVANVIPGDASLTIKTAGGYWFYTSRGTSRLIDCIETVDTPAPTPAESLVPTKAPFNEAFSQCNVQYACVTTQYAVDEYLRVCGHCPSFWSECDPPWCVPAPTMVSPRLTAAPTLSLTGNPSTTPSEGPTRGPTRPGDTRGPTEPPTKAPTEGPTRGPTRPGETRAPTASPITGLGEPTAAPTDGVSPFKIVIGIGFVMNVLLWI